MPPHGAMRRADVLVVGGGPAGSSCASILVAAGRDVIVIDRARFPRDKPCAGWITPEVVAALGLDLAAYASRHTLQPITGFRFGWIGGRARTLDYPEPVSYGIRRCELDNHLLEASGARLALGTPAKDIQRFGDRWRVDETFEAPLLVGAGGHFCPVARMLGGAAAARARGDPPLVAAYAMELQLEPRLAVACPVAGERPELYFTPDLAGYGWCLRKGDHLDLGLGRRDTRALRRHLDAFLAFLARSGRVPDDLPAAFHGHAYRLREGRPRRLVADSVLLVGDAAGLAHPSSGEGILTAVLSGQLAAEVLLEAGAETTEARLAPYVARLAERVGPWAARLPLPEALTRLAGRLTFSSSWLTRRLVLDHLFLHRAGRPPVTWS
jgi:menaquinone-9 beta-reductase